MPISAKRSKRWCNRCREFRQDRISQRSCCCFAANPCHARKSRARSISKTSCPACRPESSTSACCAIATGATRDRASCEHRRRDDRLPEERFQVCQLAIPVRGSPNRRYFHCPGGNYVRLQLLTRHNRPVQRELKKCVKPSSFLMPVPGWRNPAAADSISPHRCPWRPTPSSTPS